MEFLESNKFKTIVNVSVFILLVALLVVNIYGLIHKKEARVFDNEVVAIKDDQTNEKEKTETEKVEDNKLYVDIKGAVKKPGVYEVDKDMIINDVIKMAGGLKSNASTKYVNLSKKVTDQMVINIYTVNQVKKLNINSNEPCIAETEDISDCEGSTIIETKPSSNNSFVSGEEKTTANNNNQNISKININTASVSELTTLNGIGEAKANSIVEYRESNGPFRAIEDIMNVSGIGEAAYNKIKDSITI